MCNRTAETPCIRYHSNTLILLRCVVIEENVGVSVTLCNDAYTSTGHPGNQTQNIWESATLRRPTHTSQRYGLPVHLSNGVREDGGEAEVCSFLPSLGKHLLHQAGQFLQSSVHPGGEVTASHVGQIRYLIQPAPFNGSDHPIGCVCS